MQNSTNQPLEIEVDITVDRHSIEEKWTINLAEEGIEVQKKAPTHPIAKLSLTRETLDNLRVGGLDLDTAIATEQIYISCIDPSDHKLYKFGKLYRARQVLRSLMTDRNTIDEHS